KKLKRCLVRRTPQPTPRYQSHNRCTAKGRKVQQKAKQEAQTREKKPRGLIEYYGSKLGFKRGGTVPPGFARGGPILQQIGRQRSSTGGDSCCSFVSFLSRKFPPG